MIPSLFRSSDRLNCGYHRHPDAQYAFVSGSLVFDLQQWCFFHLCEVEVGVDLPELLVEEDDDDDSPSLKKHRRTENEKSVRDQAAALLLPWEMVAEFFCRRLRLPKCLFGFLQRTFFPELDDSSIPSFLRILQFCREVLLKMDRVELLFRMFTRKGRGECVLHAMQLAEVVEQIARANASLQRKFADTNFVSEETYVETVVIRIFFLLNTSNTGRITLREFRHSSFVSVLSSLSEITDLTGDEEPFFFSYRVVSIVWYLFLDFRGDCYRDFEEGASSSAEELELSPTVPFEWFGAGRGFSGLTRSVREQLVRRVYRVFSDGGQFSKSRQPLFDYADFVYVFLAETDVTTKASIRYWFQVLDIYGDRRLDLNLAHALYFRPEVLCALTKKTIDCFYRGRLDPAEFDLRLQKVNDFHGKWLPFICDRMGESSPCLSWSADEMVHRAKESPQFRYNIAGFLYSLFQPEFAYRWLLEAEPEFCVSHERRRFQAAAGECAGRLDLSIDTVIYCNCLLERLIDEDTTGTAATLK